MNNKVRTDQMLVLQSIVKKSYFKKTLSGKALLTKGYKGYYAKKYKSQTRYTEAIKGF